MPRQTPTQNAAPASKQLVDLITTTLKTRRDAVIELESSTAILQIHRTIIPNGTLGLSLATFLKDRPGEQVVLERAFAFAAGLDHLRSLLTTPAPEEHPPKAALNYIGNDDLYRTLTDRFLVRITTPDGASNLEARLQE